MENQDVLYVVNEKVMESIVKYLEKGFGEVDVETSTRELVDNNLCRLGLIVIELHELFDVDFDYGFGKEFDVFPTVGCIVDYFYRRVENSNFVKNISISLIED